MITVSMVNGPRGPYFKVEGEGFSLRMLNRKALGYFMIKQLKLDREVAKILMIQLNEWFVIEIDMDKAKAS